MWFTLRLTISIKPSFLFQFSLPITNFFFRRRRRRRRRGDLPWGRRDFPFSPTTKQWWITAPSAGSSPPSLPSPLPSLSSSLLGGIAEFGEPIPRRGALVSAALQPPTENVDPWTATPTSSSLEPVLPVPLLLTLLARYNRCFSIALFWISSLLVSIDY